VLVRIDDTDDLGMVRQVLRAFEYWRLKKLAVDIVFLNERESSYVQDLQVALETLARGASSRPLVLGEPTRGGVFVLRSDIISSEARLTLLAAARAVLLSRRGSLAEQLDRLEQGAPPAIPPDVSSRASPGAATAPAHVPTTEFFNGLGGFAPTATNTSRS
jgi:cyclic beta-1,2-glucan synthetase